MGNVLLVMVMLNGVPVGSPFVIKASEPGCTNELATIRGINKSLLELGSTLKYNAICSSSPE
jgi:hypothetical protein